MPTTSPLFSSFITPQYAYFYSGANNLSSPPWNTRLDGTICSDSEPPTSKLAFPHVHMACSDVWSLDGGRQPSK